MLVEEQQEPNSPSVFEEQRQRSALFRAWRSLPWQKTRKKTRKRKMCEIFIKNREKEKKVIEKEEMK